MLRLPEWAQKFIENKECPYCGHFLKNCKILHMGIKLRSEEKFNDGCCLCFDARCKKCENIASTTIVTDVNFSALQIANEIYKALEDFSVVKSTKKKNNKNVPIDTYYKKYKIPDSESSELKKFLQQNDDYESFLKFIGVSDFEIKRASYED
jgi:hypothetical protein